MTKQNVEVRFIRPDDQNRWSEMWRDYLAFYKQSLAPEITSETCRRFLDDKCPMFCLVAENDAGSLIGFATHVVHPGTWGMGNVCYLEDLYVSPDARRMGVARHMIETLIQMGKEQNWYRLYWHTDDDNHTARALYDKIGTLTDYVKYDVPL